MHTLLGLGLALMGRCNWPKPQSLLSELFPQLAANLTSLPGAPPTQAYHCRPLSLYRLTKAHAGCCLSKLEAQHPGPRSWAPPQLSTARDLPSLALLTYGC